ncbi:hypothetical protein [Nocardia sp. alder85J]|uniref:hypothetical protein n=1 Tax=Nocardia sp. alder85J TaxID=2862949 RepID=UPI001CD4009A|nr:hypothetical protein [Nocardia sp. alder85J]MCX4098430.1 hypothetical protein [Nocardia sp. alder85J]
MPGSIGRPVEFLATLHHLCLVSAVVAVTGAAVSAAMVIAARRPGHGTTGPGT